MKKLRTKARPQTMHFYMVKPSKYDDEGYVIQWLRSEIPSNSLAALNGIALDLIEQDLLGEDVEIELHPIDELNTRIRPEKIIRTIEQAGGKGLVALVGVQTNQYPRAMDIARTLRAAGVQVCIGGFHVSGCQTMLPGLRPEIQQAMDLGISIFTGEAEGRLAEVLNDAYQNRLKPYYDYAADLPGLEEVPIPFLSKQKIKRTRSARSSFDSGRGCPFQCSFCTIINVQGRKSRYRTADDIEKILRENLAQGVMRFFITDDNFARNKNWEAIFDRIIEVREDTGIEIKLIIQVDTLCHKIPNFIEKARRAGVNRAFIGLENINPDNLRAAKKGQNKITEYRAMLQAWKRSQVTVFCGYIIGFPGDTQERVLRDLEILKRELPIDILEFFCLTPLPGSEDHQVLDAKGVWMDPDLNKYDVEHVCTDHPNMSREEFFETYQIAWDRYYTDEHIETLMRRTVAMGTKACRITNWASWFYGCYVIEALHPLQGGIIRCKHRKERRPGMPLESVFTFYPRYVWELIYKLGRFAKLYWKYYRIQKRVENDPAKKEYTDLAIRPVQAEDLDELEMFTVDESSRRAVENARRRTHRKTASTAPTGSPSQARR